MGKTGPEIELLANLQGLEQITVTTDKGNRADGIALLQRALPALSELDRLTRAPSEKANRNES